MTMITMIMMMMMMIIGATTMGTVLPTSEMPG